MAGIIWLIVWLLALLGAVIGGEQLSTLSAAVTAPQQAAGAAMAAAIAIIPYIGARAISSIIEWGRREKLIEELKIARIALHELVERTTPVTAVQDLPLTKEAESI